MATTQENVSISLKLSWQMLLWILWNSQKIDSRLWTQLSTWLLTDTLEFFKKIFFNANSKSEKIFHFTPCVYLAYLRSYSHLNIVKYIGMY